MSEWKNSVNNVIGVVGILLSLLFLKLLYNTQRIKLRMMSTLFNGNPGKIIVSCYSAINASDETDIITFYNELHSLVRHMPTHNILHIGGVINAHIGKEKRKNPADITPLTKLVDILRVFHSETCVVF